MSDTFGQGFFQLFLFNGIYNSNSLDSQWKDWNINYIGLTMIL